MLKIIRARTDLICFQYSYISQPMGKLVNQRAKVTPVAKVTPLDSIKY